MAGTVNPYSLRPREPGEAPGPVTTLRPHAAYTVPDIPESTDPDYRDGYAPPLHVGPSSTPDDIRIGRREPPLNDPNDYEYYQDQSRDYLHRHSVEETTTHWDVVQHKLPTPNNPYWTQERKPIRPTADDSPTSYWFKRPWHIPRNIKDVLGEDAVTHQSMADHRRDYNIGGMKPQGIVGVNTFRRHPVPWDENLIASSTNASVSQSPVYDERSYVL